MCIQNRKPKDRQYNGQKKKTDSTMAKRKRTNNEPQSATKKFNVCV